MSTVFFDGNAAAGELRELFSVDLTAATGECASCGNVAALAQTRIYAFLPGLVIRCAVCEQPLLRLVKNGRRAWLDLRGLVYLQLELT
ncbi:MAG TPA: DUF6510 family protein [Candidatus Cybelea sp.]|jgi:hypothetical protein